MCVNTIVLTSPKRRAIAAIYAFARRVDDVADGTLPLAEKREQLEQLRAALAELVARLAHEAEEQGCRLRIKVEQDVPDSLEGDVARLQLVLKNLLGNAFSLAPGAEVALQVTPEYTTHGGIQLSFAVHAAGESAAKASASSRAVRGSVARAGASGPA